MHRFHQTRAPALLLAGMLALAAAPAAAGPADDRDLEAFRRWLPSHAPQVAAFQQFLRQQGVADVVPVYQLLRSASMWKECKADPFQVPPAAVWPLARDVLLLLRHMQRSGVIGPFEVVSAYRGPKLNKCAGGSRRSSHMRFAVDIVPLAPGDDQRLCAFWREQGQRYALGLSRYPSGRIHVDRNGWRTWGADHTRRTSFCNQLAEKRPSG